RFLGPPLEGLRQEPTGESASLAGDVAVCSRHSRKSTETRMATKMNSLARTAILSGLLLVSGLQNKPAQDKAAERAHHHDVVEKGDHVMGFSHDKATHHFRLYADGGAIEVRANDPKDTVTRDAIQSHFSHIATMFAAGDFNAPILIHSQDPPGSETLRRLRAKIDYPPGKVASGPRSRIPNNKSDA